MSDLPPENPEQNEQQGTDLPVSDRAASVNLRDNGAGPGAQGSGPDLDTANQSLFDALRITFRLLQFGMVVIGALYILSGFQSVGSGERGLRVLFGKVAASDVQPGFRFSFPYPIGEMVRIETTAAPLAVDRAFWPDTRGSASDTVDSLPQSIDLNPARDGSLVTADGNIAHTRWTVVYERADADSYARNVLPADERKLVQHCVSSAVISAVAGTTIDDLLKNTSRDGIELDSKVRQLAQTRLDDLDTGISLRQVTIRDRIPPASLRDEFASVQEAQSKSAERVTEARKTARLMLTGAAGLAAEPLISQINEYERQIELGDQAAAAATLGVINSMLEGEAADVEGARMAGQTSGIVTDILSQARQYATTVVNDRRAQLAIFNAKQSQFDVNPLVTVQSSWREAYTEFMRRENVQVLINPPGVSSLELLINEDPDIVKDIDRARKLRENREELDRRNREILNAG